MVLSRCESNFFILIGCGLLLLTIGTVTFTATAVNTVVFGRGHRTGFIALAEAHLGLNGFYVSI